MPTVADLSGCIALLLVVMADEKSYYLIRPETLLNFIGERLRDYIFLISGRKASIGAAAAGAVASIKRATEGRDNE